MLFDCAFGSASLATGAQLTPRHRFRVASHSKTFTAAGILRLHEQRRLRLQDPVRTFVQGLHPAVDGASLTQLLCHSAGLSRDGADAGYFADRRGYPDTDELRRDLRARPPFEVGVCFKYSNNGYGLLGLIVEAVAGEPYGDWIRREVIEAANLTETEPDSSLNRDALMAHGHSGKLPVGRRLVIPGNIATGAISAATGFVTTARDLVLFYAQVAPTAGRSFLNVASRRAMTRRRWRDDVGSAERYYGFGTIVGPPGPWWWFGHSGNFQGFATRAAAIPQQGLAIAVLTNAIDGPASAWWDGVAHILEAFSRRGAPAPEVAAWAGRWWSLWGPVDLVPFKRRVALVNPSSHTPFTDAAEIEVDGPLVGTLVKSSGFSSPGEPVRRVLDASGRPRELWVGGTKLVQEADLVDEMLARYGCDGTVR